MNHQRRKLLLTGASLVSLAVVPLPIPAKRFGPDDFIALSARLTGRPSADFDAQVAARILAAFRGRGLLPQLITLAAGRRTDGTLAREIVTAWYTGICQTAEGPTLVAFEKAIVFTGSSALHAPGTCGGAFGDWSVPPSA